MFFVFDRKKISSYLISLGTVVILCAASFIVTNNTSNTLETYTKIEQNQNKLNKIHNTFLKRRIDRKAKKW